MNKNEKTILVFGATGQQGGAVARHLVADGWKVRGVTRDASKPAAQALRDIGVEVVEGNMDDRESLGRLMEGVYGVFSVQQFWEVGAEGEIRQGKAVADAAKQADVKHVLYSSVGGADRSSGIVHFESKWEIEQHIQALGLPASVLRPVFFMENFTGFAPPTEEEGVFVFRLAMQPTRPLQIIAVDDIGGLAALMFGAPEKYIGQGIEIAGDDLTIPQVAEAFSRATGRPARFEEVPIEAVRSFSEESAVMFEWFNNAGYTADIAALREIYPGLKNFDTWLAQSEWAKQIAAGATTEA